MNTENQSRQSEQCKSGEPAPIHVTGRVRRPLSLCANELYGMETEEVTDLPIICGTGTPKGKISHGRGVLLENVIRMAEVIKDEKDDTKKMFIVASGRDGYKVVFSWQEIFNTPIGGGVMILIERDGELPNGAGGRLDLISTQDYFTGSRYVKGLERIELMVA